MRKGINYFLLFALVFRLAGVYFFNYFPDYQKGDLVVIRSCLEQQPQLKGENQIFSLAGIKVLSKEEKRFNFGDCLEVKGKINSYQKYEKEFFLLENPEIKNWTPDFQKGILNTLKKAGFQIQAKAQDFYQRFLPEPISSLISGIVLGAKSRLPADFYQKLQTTGTLHIVVASGYNLTVISQFPVDFLAWFAGRKGALFLGAVLVWFYVLISGSQPPIVRAGIMISLIYLAQFLGRKTDYWRVFWLTAWSMLVINPKLLTNISFQLSFGAMFGILYFEGKLNRLRELRVIGNLVAESLSAQLMVLPLIAFHFNTFSWASVLVNIFVLPLVPSLMVFGLLALGGLFFGPLGFPFLFLAYPLGWTMVRIINWFGNFSFLQVNFPFSCFLLFAYYLFIFYFFQWRQKD